MRRNERLEAELARTRLALAGAAALARARASRAFTATHDEFWSTARRRLGDAAGTLVLVKVLRDAGRALRRVDRCQVVMIEARRAEATVVPIGALARYDRPAPSRRLRQPVGGHLVTRMSETAA